MTQKQFSVQVHSLKAREVLDSRGFPTVEAELKLKSSDEVFLGRAAVPSGASTGEFEALELRDGDPKRFLGKGVLKAVQNVNESIALAVAEKTFTTQSEFDQALLALDGTPNKSKLGANAILAASMAFARAASASQGQSARQYLAELLGGEGTLLPVPLMNILNGGKHADNGLAIQEFMIVPAGFDRFSEALRAGTEVFHHLKKILHSKNLSTAVGDEGGFAPALEGPHPHQQAIELILQAVRAAGYEPGRDIFLALDCAASEFSKQRSPTGSTKTDAGVTYEFEGQPRSSKEMIALYTQWVENYPIVSIEDGLSEHDWDGWVELTSAIGGRCQLVGDDLFVTNPAFLRKGIVRKAANAILIKLNQIGSVTETLDAMKLAAQHRYAAIASHRSGETEDTFIADLAVGTQCGQIKTGSASRTDRTAKYNQLLRIEEELGTRARFAGKTAFKKR